MLLKDNVLRALDDLYIEQVMSKCSTKEECKNLRLGVLKAICVVKELPTVDAEPVRHGKWERTDITAEDGWALYRCSCCNWHTTYYYSFSASPTYNYCPNCGAKMG